MIRNKKLIYGGVIIFSLTLITMSIAFALLSSTATMTVNKTTQNALTWDIGFDPNTKSTGNVAADCNVGVITSTTVSNVSATFYKTNSKCLYNLILVNNGDIAGQISGITMTPPTGMSCTTNGSTMTCGNVKYTVSYDPNGEQLVQIGDILEAKSGTTATKKNVFLNIYYELGEGVGDFTSQGFSYQLNFSQK